MDGSATKGVILGGHVTVVDANDPTLVIATGTTSLVDGSFDLEIDGSAGFDGGVVKVIVTGGDGVRMICDAPSGCYGTPFGGQIEISKDFVLAALVETPADGGNITVHVNAITTLASALAEFNAGDTEIDRTDLIAANDQVAGLFGLEGVDLWSLRSIDITDAGTGEPLSAEALRAAYINAGILEALLEGTGTLDQRLAALLADFTGNGGRLIANEGADNPNTVSLEDIFGAAYNTATGSTREDEAGAEASNRLEADFLATTAATPGMRTTSLPERPVLSVSAESLSFSGIRGRSIPGTSIQVQGGGIPWTVSSSVPWLRFDAGSGVADSQISVYPLSNSASIGDNHGSFTVRDLETPKQVTVNVDFKVGDALQLSSYGPIPFDVVYGETNPQTSSIKLSGQNISWKASSDQAWASVTPSSGLTPDTITINADPSGLPVGTHTAYVTVSDTEFDQSATLRINTRVHPRMIRVEETGVSFSSFPGRYVLKREIDVTDNLGKPLDWTATSDAAWLSVTPSGKTDGVLTLQANPAGLTPGQLYTAQVRVETQDESVENTEHINVSLWVGSADPEAQVEVAVPAAYIATDPVKPYLYASRDGATDVEILNVFTGEPVGLIESVTASNGAMTVSPDGETLYVADKTNSRIVPVDLKSGTVQAPFGSVSLETMTVRRVNGKAFLFTGGGKVYDAETGDEVVSSLDVWLYDSQNGISVSKNGETMCLINSGVSPYSLYCYGLSYSYLDGGVLTLAYHGNVAHGVGSNGADSAISDDGTRVYAASGSPYQFLVFDTTTLEQVQVLDAEPYPNAVEMGPNGIVYGGIDGYYADIDAWAYDQEGNLRGTYDISGSYNSLLRRQLAVSGDDSRLIGATQDGYIVIVSTN
ncbi:MAG: BACON domain-containing carbohydrate-binding protein [Hyphomonas sp.]